MSCTGREREICRLEGGEGRRGEGEKEREGEGGRKKERKGGKEGGTLLCSYCSLIPTVADRM